MKKNPSHFYARWGLPILTLVALLSLFPGMIHLPLLDRDEPRFARATVEMMERADWIIPTFNEDYRFDKPPLTYWWMAAHYAMWGTHEAGARLHSLLATLFVAWLLFFAGSRWFSPASGFWAGIGWLTCLQVLIHGRLALADMPMVLAVVASQILILQRLRQEKGEPWGIGFWGLYLSLALGFLAKGPIAWFVPALTLLLWRWVFWRKPLDWSRFKPLKGTCLLLGLIGIWGIPALWLTGGTFWEKGIGYHVVDRGLEVFHDRRFIPGIYFLTAFLSLLPWVHRLPDLLRFLKFSWSAETSFLLAWMLSPFLIFSFYATQLPHYTLPGFPAFFLLLFGSAALTGSEPGWSRAFRFILNSLWVFLSFLGLGLLLYVGWFKTIEPQTAILLGIASLALIPLILVYLGSAWSPGHIRWRSLLFGLLALAATIEAASQALRPYSPAIQLRQLIASDETVAPRFGYRYGEPSLVFYTGSGWEFGFDLADLETFLEDNPHGLILALATEYKLEDYAKHVLRDEPRMPRRDYREELDGLSLAGYQRRVLSGINFARGAWITLYLYQPLSAGMEKYDPGPRMALTPENPPALVH